MWCTDLTVYTSTAYITGIMVGAMLVGISWIMFDRIVKSFTATAENNDTNLDDGDDSSSSSSSSNTDGSSSSDSDSDSDDDLDVVTIRAELVVKVADVSTDVDAVLDDNGNPIKEQTNEVRDNTPPPGPVLKYKRMVVVEDNVISTDQTDVFDKTDAICSAAEAVSPSLSSINLATSVVTTLDILQQMQRTQQTCDATCGVAGDHDVSNFRLQRKQELVILDDFNFLVGLPYVEAEKLACEKGYHLHILYLNDRSLPPLTVYDSATLGVRINADRKVVQLLDVGGVDGSQRGRATSKSFS